MIGLGLSLGASELRVAHSLTLVTIGHVVINLPLAFAVILSQMNEAQEPWRRLRATWVPRRLGCWR